MTVADGFVQAVWTFNGTVPGPVIRVHLGDTIRVHLKNPVTNKLAHSVDFHASQVAWNDEMTSIKPGEEKLYEWRADYAGVWMYHCGTAPALHHIANGMYGMVIVEPKGGFKPVDKEFALVQSEWYLGPQGQPVDLDQGLGRRAGPGLRRVQWRRQPVQGQPARGPDRRQGPALRPRCRTEHRQLVPHRRDDLRHGDQGGHPADARQPRSLRLPGRRPVTGPGCDHRARRHPRTASTRSSPTPSTSSGAAPSACSRPATATRSSDPQSDVRADLTKRADYAIRAMIALARHDGDEPAQRSSDRRRDGHPGPVPAPGHGRSGRGRARARHEPGRNGGHRLARPAATIDLLDDHRGGRGRQPAAVVRPARWPLRRRPANATSTRCSAPPRRPSCGTLADADLASIARRRGRHASHVSRSRGCPGSGGGAGRPTLSLAWRSSGPWPTRRASRRRRSAHSRRTRRRRRGSRTARDRSGRPRTGSRTGRGRRPRAGPDDRPTATRRARAARSIAEKASPNAAVGIPRIELYSLSATSSQPMVGPHTGSPPDSFVTVRYAAIASPIAPMAAIDEPGAADGHGASEGEPDGACRTGRRPAIDGASTRSAAGSTIAASIAL